MVILQELLSTLLQASEKSWQVPESCRTPHHLPCLAVTSLLREGWDVLRRKGETWPKFFTFVPQEILAKCTLLSDQQQGFLMGS